MEKRNDLLEMIQELRIDCAIKQRMGLHFIITSILIWIAITLIHMSSMPMISKNLFTFCCSAPLLPLSYLLSKWIHVDFSNKGNPLTNLGILFSVNQILYLLIAMWIYVYAPKNMLMVYAMIFGAHLLPYGWLYQSKIYYVFSVLIPIIALIVFQNFGNIVLSSLMIVIEIVFCISLNIEYKMKYAPK